MLPENELTLQRKRTHAWADVQLAPATLTTKACKGLVVVLTGEGKGKTSSAMHMAQRAVVAERQVGVVQFCGGSPNSCEYKLLAANPLCDFQIFGAECTWEGTNRTSDLATVQYAWHSAAKMIGDPSYDMVILDEIHLLLKYNYLNLAEVLLALRKRPPAQHVVLTGRGAPFELTDFADTVTEMRKVKHHAAQAWPAQAGIEF